MIDELKQLFPHALPGWVAQLADQPPLFGIDTPHELASFIAQLQQESLGLTRFEENLYYSTPERLVSIWPSRFGIPDSHGVLHQGRTSAYLYVRQPEKLANFVYANRGGNGEWYTGEGWRYRGRGPIQLTLKENYLLCGDGIGYDLLKHPELLLEPLPGMRSACWYWKARNLDKHDDDLDVRAETRLVNGGTHGLAQRQQFFNHALKMLSA